MGAVKGKDITVSFSGRRCIHSRRCVTGSPEAFQADAEGEWINPDAAPCERIVEIAHSCPSGAITYERHDGGPAEAAPPVNLARLTENGPIAFHAELVIDGAPAGFRATLCRCGASTRKPYCDGSHTAAGFAATGEPAANEGVALEARNGPLAITPNLDGPLEVVGNLEFVAGSGRRVGRARKCFLCRCGGSQNKPYCDGSHKTNGFKSG